MPLDYYKSANLIAGLSKLMPAGMEHTETDHCLLNPLIVCSQLSALDYLDT